MNIHIEKKKLWLAVLLCLLFFPGSLLLAQKESEKGLPFITNYLPKTYKALPQTWSVIEDNRGIMYFGVQTGILEYDGVKWRKVIFKIPPAVIRALAKDEKGKIYYGAIGDFGYLGKDSLGQTIAVSLLDKVPKALRNFYDVWTIHVTDNGVYFQSRELILRLNEKNEVKGWKPKARFMYSFYLDDNYYVHEQGLGLFKMVSDSLQFIAGSEFLGKERMQVMLPYGEKGKAQKEYLLGVFYSGLYLFNGSSFRPFESEATPLLKAGTLYKGAKTRDGEYILSTTGRGLVIIDEKGKILQQINRDVGLQDESVYAVYPDSKGIIWLALDNGISRVETSSPLTQFTNQAGINTSTLSLVRFNGILYLGTTNGLMRFNDAAAKFEAVDGIPPNQTFSLLKDGNKLLVPNDGLFAVEDNRVKLIQPSVGGDMQLAALMRSTKFPGILYGGQTSGVSLFIKNGESWKYAGKIPKLDDQIWTFMENKDGSVWVGTQNQVVYRFMPSFDANGQPILKDFKVERFGAEQGLVSAVGNVFDVKGEAWFPADSVIYKYDEAQKKFRPDYSFGHFPQGGAKEEFFIVEDARGRIILRFGKETMIGTPQPDGKYKMNKTALLPIADRSVSFIYPEENGIVWVGTTDGLVRFDETLEKDYNASFKTVLRRIAAGSHLLNTDIDSNTERPSIAYKNNTLRFEYAAPFFEQEDKTQYQTWLEGFEEDWSAWDNNYYKEYTNLPGGDYKFHVRSLNIYQKQSEEAVYEFNVLPPWYATWWAYTLYALLAAGIIYSLIRWRTRQLQEKHKELEKTVAERTAELSHRLDELAVINSVQEGLVREMNMQGIFEMVGEKIREIFNAQVIDIVTYDSKNDLLEDRYAYEKGDRTLVGTWKPFGFRQLVIDTKQMLLINTDLEKKSKELNSAVLRGEQPKSAVFVPLITSNEVKGMISLQDLEKENAFTDSHVSLLTTLANSMSVALESARRFDETNRLLKEMEQRTAELAVINSVQEGLAKELDMQAIYEMVGDRIRDVFNAQVVIIATLDQEKGVEHFKYLIEKGERFYLAPRPYDKLRQQMLKTREKILINQHSAETAAAFGMKVLPGTELPKSMLFVPLVTGEKVKSYVSLQNIDEENAFSDSDVRLLETLANSMSVALENARLFDETNHLLRETEQRTAELAVINSVQEGLAKELDMKGIYDLVGERLCELFPDSQTLVIRTFDHESGLEHWQYAIEKGERQFVQPRPINWNSRELIRTKKPLDIEENYLERSKQHGGTGVTAGQPPKSAVFVPMLVGDLVKGSISLQNVDRENAFTDSDLRLLTTITNSMSVALENARLFEETSRLLKETEQHKAELGVINSVQEGLVREMDMNAIYELVGNRICELFDTQTVLIRTFDHKTQNEIWQFAIEKGERMFSKPRPWIWANQLLIKTKQPLIINEDYVGFARQHGGTGVSKGLPPKSAVFVPMIVGDVVRGSVSLQNVEKENAFSEADLRLLTTLTNSMSVALENARLFDETTHLLAEAKQRATELSTVNSVSRALAAQLNPDELIQLVGDQMKDLFRANIVYLALLNPKNKVIYFPYQYGEELAPMKLGEGWASQIIRKGEPLLINKDVQELRTQLGMPQIGIPAASYLGVPIPVGDEIIGVLSVQSTEHENRFNENDQRLLSTIASSVGVALRNAKLFEEVKQAKQEAEMASKIAEKANAAKSAFLSTVSHELRTPLTSVLGFAKIIRKRLEEKIFPAVQKADNKVDKTINQISENLQVVIAEGERLTHLINDVLDLAKIEAGKMEWNFETVSIAEIVDRAISASSSLFEQKSLNFEKYIEPDLPAVSGDRDKLIQVIINLISNSVKFTDTGSVSCRVYRKNEEVIVSISDTGIGIAEEDFAAVFEQFKQVGGDTLTDKPKGTGLGLPICKEIIEHHGGRIWLESEVGKGSTFSFALPVTKATSIKPINLDDLVKQLKEQMTQSKISTSGKAASILIVDDDDSIRSLLQQELSEGGYLIEEATNGKEALERIRKHRPDLIILDVMMPEMNGFDVAAILKNDPQTMDIPIIVLSIVQDKIRGYRIGVDRYLTKPIDTAQLFTEVGALLQQGKSKKKVMVVDEDSTAIRSLTDVLEAKGYNVVESNGNELVEKAIAAQPDIIILNSIYSGKQEMVQALRFEKGLENVLFLMYQ